MKTHGETTLKKKRIKFVFIIHSVKTKRNFWYLKTVKLFGLRQLASSQPEHSENSQYNKHCQTKKKGNTFSVTFPLTSFISIQP